jgi:hypothetical protein
VNNKEWWLLSGHEYCIVLNFDDYEVWYMTIYGDYFIRNELVEDELGKVKEYTKKEMYEFLLKKGRYAVCRYFFPEFCFSEDDVMSYQSERIKQFIKESNPEIFVGKTETLYFNIQEDTYIIKSNASEESSHLCLKTAIAWLKRQGESKLYSQLTQVMDERETYMPECLNTHLLKE